MPSIVNWSIDAAVGGGPAMAVANSFLAEAYSVVEVVVDGADAATEPFQAGTIDEVTLMLITSSHYDADDLSFTLNGIEVALDQPQLYLGAGMLSRFGAGADVSEITVTNDLADQVTVTVLIGRAAS